MIQYKESSDGNRILDFSAAQEKCKQTYEQWVEIFKRIRSLWEKLQEIKIDDEVENELRINIKTLYFFLLERKAPPNEIVQMFCFSGLFVDMFSSMQTANYHEYILGIICFIIERNPEEIPLMLKHDLSKSVNTFLSSKGMNEKTKICALYYASLYFKSMAKCNENAYNFFFCLVEGELNYFQISCQIIDECLKRESEDSSEIDQFDDSYRYIRRTMPNIYSMFSYLVKWIVLNAKGSENDELPEIKQIFFFISQAFELKLDWLYLKLIVCLDRIWKYSFELTEIFFQDQVIYQPICQIINDQQPEEAQQDAIILIYKLIEHNSDLILPEIDPEKIFQTANQAYGRMIDSSIYDKTTLNAILLLGKIFLIDNMISIDIESDMNDLLGMISGLINDLDYAAQNAASFLVFAIIQISGLDFFQDSQDKMSIIEKAFDVAFSGDFLVLENAILAAQTIYGMIETGNESALPFADLLDRMISDMYESNEHEELFDIIESLYNNYVKDQ